MTWIDDPWPGQHGWCSDPPIVSEWAPAPGAQLETLDSVSFVLQSLVPIRNVLIRIVGLSGRSEVAFVEGAFLPLYRQSTREAFTTDPAFREGWRFTVRRLAPYAEPVGVVIEATNETGLSVVIGGPRPAQQPPV